MVIYQIPTPELCLDQGDIIEGCPILQIASFDPEDPEAPEVSCSTQRVVVLT